MLLACSKVPPLPLMLQEAAGMKKYDNVSTRAETGRCSGSALVRSKVSNGAVALGNILPRARHPPIEATMLVSEMR